jgi:hypothetical protein
MTTKVFDAFTRLDASDVNDFLVNRPIQNFIINGAMQIAQRGTSVTGVTVGTYLVDRWLDIGFGSYGTWTLTQENDAPTGSGFRRSAKVLCTTANASLASSAFKGFDQRFEGQNLQSIRKGTSDAQQLTLQFWVKSNVTGTYAVRLGDIDNSRSVCASYSVSASGTWEKKTLVFPADTVGALDNDNNHSLFARWYLAAGTDFTSGSLQTTWGATVNANMAVGQVNLAAATNNYWQITGVQLEVGDIANDFQFQDIQKELAACQRYYYRASATASNPFSIFTQAYGANAGGQAFLHTRLPVTMRARPTSVEFSNLQLADGVNAGITVTAVALDGNTLGDNIAVASFNVASGLTQFRPYVARSANSSSGFLAFSAEL